MWPSRLWRAEIMIPAKLCKNNKANHMVTGNEEYRGLKLKAPLVLSEGGKRYSLKI